MLQLFVGVVVLLAIQDIDRPSLKSLVAGQFGAIEDLTCEYEGQMFFPKASPSESARLKLGEGGLHESFSGVFVSKSDGSRAAHIYRKYMYAKEVTHQTISQHKGKSEEFMESGEQKRGQGQIKIPHFRDFDREGSLGRIMLTPVVIGYLDDEKCEMEVGAGESIGGRDCLKVIFTTFAVKPDGTRRIYQKDAFWLDMLRGANPLKREIHTGDGELVSRVDKIELSEFKDKSGKSHWIPVGGLYEAFGEADDKGEITYADTPSNREKLWVVVGTTRLNTHPPDDRFSANFKVGTSVMDRVKGEQFEVGQDLRPPPMSRADAEERLVEQIRKAEEQGSELKASSWERNGYGWKFWAISCLALLASISTGIWFYRRSH